jgi:hypothetical protein
MASALVCATRTSSKIAGQLSPYRQFFRILQDVHGDFVIGLEDLFGVGSEWFHLAFAISWRRGRIRLEIEPAPMDDAEEHPTTVQPVSAEHGAAGQAGQLAELIQYEVSESVVLRWHGRQSMRFARRDHPDSDGKGDAVVALVSGRSLDDQLLDPLQLIG